jgi:hypothetical protein
MTVWYAGAYAPAYHVRHVGYLHGSKGKGTWHRLPVLKKKPRGKREFPQLNINQNKKVITVKKKPLFSCSETHTVEFASRQRHY